MNPWLTVVCALATLSGLGLLYTTWRLARPPTGTPARIRTAANSMRPLVLCLGDSITHGHIGADWVGALRRTLAQHSTLVANGGINGQQAWNLLQRLDADLLCRPAAVVLLVGSNDVMAAERPDRAARYIRANKLPHAPDLESSGAHLEELLGRLQASVPHVALCTVPPLGAAPDHPAEQLVATWNLRVRSLARSAGVTLLDVHAALRPLNESATRAYEGSPGAVAWTISKVCIEHYLRGRSWDTLSAVAGWGATVDGIHLSDRAGLKVGELVGGWLQSVDFHEE